jgi:hypothetical protein
VAVVPGIVNCDQVLLVNKSSNQSKPHVL